MIEIETRPGQHRGLTDKLQNLYAYIADYQLNHHVSPTRQMMQNELGIGGTALNNYLKSLEEQGYLKSFGYGWWTVVGIEYTDKRNERKLDT